MGLHGRGCIYLLSPLVVGSSASLWNANLHMYTAGTFMKVKQQKGYSWEVGAWVQGQNRSGYICRRAHLHRAGYCHRLKWETGELWGTQRCKRCYNSEERKGPCLQFMCIWQRDSYPMCKDLYLTTYARINSSLLSCYTRVHSPYGKFLLPDMFQNSDIFVFYKDNSVYILNCI